MKVKCQNCFFETEYPAEKAGQSIPCASCEKPVSTPRASTAPPLKSPPVLPSSGAAQSSPPPIPTIPTAAGSEAGAPARKLANDLLAVVALFARRILRSNLYSERVTAHEVAALESCEPPVTSPIAQSYLGWRRALLWFGGICLGIAVLLDLPDFFETLGDENMPGIITFVSFAFLAAKNGAAALAVLAALKWDQIKFTRTTARLSWICLFIVPLLIGLLPISYFIDHEVTGIPEAQVNFQFGLLYFILLTPSLLGLFPGIVRSALTLKTMLPESQMPGWVALIIAPLYALFLAIGLVLAAQAQDFLTAATFIAFIAAPVIVVLNSAKLVSPAPPEVMLKNIASVKGKVAIAYATGLFLATLLALRFINKANLDIGFFDVLGFVSALLANLFMVTVVVSDLLLTLFNDAFHREVTLREEGLIEDLEERFRDLDEIGLTQLGAGEGEMIDQLRGKVRKMTGGSYSSD